MGIDLSYFFASLYAMPFTFLFVARKCIQDNCIDMLATFCSQRPTQKKLEKSGELKEGKVRVVTIDWAICTIALSVGLNKEQKQISHWFHIPSLFASMLLLHKDKGMLPLLLMCFFVHADSWDLFLPVKSLHFTGVMVWKWYSVFFYGWGYFLHVLHGVTYTVMLAYFRLLLLLSLFSLPFF